MKKTKILVPAMGMLILSTAASITGTVAWFATNASVNATNMQVIVKTNNTYLLISDTATTAAGIQSGALKAVDIAMADNESKVFPSAPCANATDTARLTVAEGHKNTAGAAISTAGAIVNSAATAAQYTNWYTAAATAPGSAALDANSVVQLASFDNYVIIKTVYLTVAAGANGAHSLTVKPTWTQNSTGTDLAAVKAIVTTDDGGFAMLSSDSTAAADISGSDTTITDSVVRTVNIYLYYDGNESVVYTNNMANLLGGKIDLEFGVTAYVGA